MTFESDTTIQGAGFTLNYSASSQLRLDLPQCSEGQQLVRALMRTREHGSEASWLLTTQVCLLVLLLVAADSPAGRAWRAAPRGTQASKPCPGSSRPATGAPPPTAPGTQDADNGTVVMMGGAVPSAALQQYTVPEAVTAAAQLDLKSLRSYPTYACLPFGMYTAYMWVISSICLPACLPALGVWASCMRGCQPSALRCERLAF